MSVDAQGLVRGAAVVIDDRIGQETDIDDLLNQLREQSIPTVELKELPTPDALIHWKQFALIVMDWALMDVEGQVDIELPPGLTAPSMLSKEVIDRNIAFIRALLEETAVPVFIATNEGKEEVNASLRDAFAESFPEYCERVHVFSKGELKPNLFETIGSWISSRPALQVLDAWRKAYVRAEIDVFHQFSRAQNDWVASIQRSAQVDGSDIRVMLRDLIAANLVNRIGPLGLALDDASASGALEDAGALRRVLHYGAVVPDSSLAPSEVTTGDMFVPDGASEPFSKISILLTPECDLTSRDKQWRFTTFTANRDPRTSKESKNRVKGAWKPSSREHHITVNLLTDDCVEYDIAINEWSSQTVVPTVAGDAFVIWPGYKRIGRLLPPYMIYLQQVLAQVVVRKGMVRLPADLYAGLGTGAAPNS